MRLVRTPAVIGTLGVLVGAAIATFTFLTAHAAINKFNADDPYGHKEPNVLTGRCDGTPYLAVIDYKSGGVSARLLIHDKAKRDWQVQWNGFGAKALAERDEDSTWAESSASLGDLDNGYQHPVRFRSVGAAEWCRAALALR